MKASAAEAFASRAEPALNPNQPTHSSEAPIMVMVRLCGCIASLPKPMRLPSMKAPTRPADAGVDVHDGTAGEVECAPLPDQARLCSHGVHGLRIGKCIRPREEPDHVRDRRIAEGEPQHHEDQDRGEFIRSAIDPSIRAQVIAAKVAWKATKTSSYIGVFLLNVAPIANSPFAESKVPFRNSRSIRRRTSCPR